MAASITRGRIKDDKRRHRNASLRRDDEEGYEDVKIG
jgi:hypothetical protein